MKIWILGVLVIFSFFDFDYAWILGFLRSFLVFWSHLVIFNFEKFNFLSIFANPTVSASSGDSNGLECDV